MTKIILQLLVTFSTDEMPTLRCTSNSVRSRGDAIAMVTTYWSSFGVFDKVSALTDIALMPTSVPCILQVYLHATRNTC